MLSISLSILVLFYILFVIFMALFALLNIYHIVASGTLSLMRFSITGLALLLMVVIVVSTGMYLSATDLSTSITILGTTPTIPSL